MLIAGLDQRSSRRHDRLADSHAASPEASRVVASQSRHRHVCRIVELVGEGWNRRPHRRAGECDRLLQYSPDRVRRSAVSLVSLACACMTHSLEVVAAATTFDTSTSRHVSRLADSSAPLGRAAADCGDAGPGGGAAGQAPRRPRPTRHPHPSHLPRHVRRPSHESEGVADEKSGGRDVDRVGWPARQPSTMRDGVPFLATRHVRLEQIDWTTLRFIAAEDAEFYCEACRPERGD